MASITSEPVIYNAKKGRRHTLEAFLDRRVLPYPVKFLTNRIVILATLALLIPLLFYTTDQAVVNVLNSYLNVMSVVVSSTVLLYATIADVRDRAAAQRREEIADEYQQVLEKRVEAEHDVNEKILELAAQNNIQNLHVERLEKVRAQDRKQAQELARAYEQVLEKRVQAQELVLEKRVQVEHELNEKILEHAVQNSIQNLVVENLEKLRFEDREHAAELAKEYEQVLEKRVEAQAQMLEKRVQEEHELNEKILEHAVQNSIQNLVVENLEKLRFEDREHAAELARAYEQVLEKRVEAQELVLEKRVQVEHELNEKILEHAVQNSIQNILVENLDKLRAEDRKHAAELAKEYEQVLEQRVQAEHELNEKILQSTIENVLGERLKMASVEEDTHAQQMHQEVITSLQSYRAELADLTQLVQTLLPASSKRIAKAKH